MNTMFVCVCVIADCVLSTHNQGQQSKKKRREGALITLDYCLQMLLSGLKVIILCIQLQFLCITAKQKDFQKMILNISLLKPESSFIFLVFFQKCDPVILFKS